MATYNDAQYLQQAIDSILNQTYTNFEFIIIDDCSTDDTARILHEIRDDRVILLQNDKNMKLAYSLNRCLDIAKGDFVFRMDADDISLPNRIEKQISYFLSHPDVDILGCNASTFGSFVSHMVYPETHEEIKTGLLFNNSLCHPAVAFRKSTLDYRYDESFSASQDYELWTRLIWTKRFHNLQEELLKYRVHSKQTNKKNGNKQKIGANYSRTQMLVKLLPDMNDIERNTFLSFCELEAPKNNDEMGEYCDFLKKLEGRNKENKYFVSDNLHTAMCKQYYLQWYNSIGYNGVSFSTIKESGYANFFNKQSLKIQLKTLLKYWYNKMRCRIGLRNWMRLQYYKSLYRLSIGENSIIQGKCEFSNSGKIQIGSNTTICRWSCFREYGGYIKIGNGCSINSFCHISGNGGITIGNNVRIATQCVLISANHIFANRDIPICQQGEIAEPIVIEDDCWLGAGVKVLSGVRIGKGSVIGAGAVVTKDIAPYSVAVGVPARIIKKR